MKVGASSGTGDSINEDITLTLGKLSTYKENKSRDFFPQQVSPAQ